MRVGRNLGVLLAAIFLIACAEELWWRFIPDYLRALGASVGVVAIYGTFKDLLDALYQFPGGLLTQRIGYRAALVIFNAMAISGYVAFATAHSWVVLVAALPLVMAWQSFSLPATFSLIGDTLPQQRRSIAFGYQSIVRRIPIVVAPIAGGAIITSLGTLAGTRAAIWIGTAVAVVALILQAVRYRIPKGNSERLALATLVRDAPQLPRKLKALLLSDIVVRFGQGIGEIFIVLYAIRVVGVSAAAFGWLTGLAMATSIAVYIPVARMADRSRRDGWVLLTYGFFALFPLLLGLSQSTWLLTIAFVAMGLREIGEPPRKAMIVDLARADRRSVDVGTYYLVRGVFVFPASLVGGALWKIMPAATFFGAAAVAATGAVIYSLAVYFPSRAWGKT
ncbi:MAG TPA: MFS transporter [Candidatus Nitrosotalea sp.]|nr:MFS transporter [Candidatus Nitrosotalea sp.]